MRNIIFLIFLSSICCKSHGQTSIDSLPGTYIGDYWFRWIEDSVFTISPDTFYVVSTNSNCSFYGYGTIGNFNGGSFQTDYDFCQASLTNYFTEFYNGDSLKIVYDQISQPPPNVHIYFNRFFGRKVSSNIPTYIKDSGTDLNISVYPNPVVDFLFLMGSHEPLQAMIYNMLGEVLVIQNYVVQGDRIYVEHLNRGIYLLKLLEINTGEVFTFKLLKN